MEKIKSIFDLEQRTNLNIAFQEVFEDLNSTVVYSVVYGDSTLLRCLEKGIRNWPYRRASNSIHAYAHSLNFAFPGRTEAEMIYCFELLVNLIKWVSSNEINYMSSHKFNRTGDSRFISECKRCYDNIEFLLEQLNMNIRTHNVVDNFPQYRIGKRDVDVDVVLESVPELADILLSYLDIRNQNSIEAKRMILKQIADFLEPSKDSKIYNGTSYHTLCDDLFYIFNSFSIRHNNDEKIKLTPKDLMGLYDATFKAAVHLLQKEFVDRFHHDVQCLKKN